MSVTSPLRNLQAAVGAYYDFYGPVSMPAISVEDVNLKAGEVVPQNMPLIKTWRVKNSGRLASPSPSTRARKCAGSQGKTLHGVIAFL